MASKISINEISKDTLVIFLHIPKTAGTTLYDVIRRQYGKSSIFTSHGFPNDIADEIKNMPSENLNRIRILKGHMVFGVHDFLDVKSTYITVLRNPIDRIVSVYYYLLQSPHHEQHALVQNKSLEDFVLANTAHNNGQTIFLAGKQTDINQPLNRLEIAKTHLKENFAVVGLTERFDETLVLLQRSLGWRNIPFYTKQNVSDRPLMQELCQKTLDLICEYNALDMELYKYAETLFNEKINQLQGSLERELNLFRSLNKTYKPMGDLYSFLRKIPISLKKF